MMNAETAFAVWSAVVALIGGAIVWELAHMRSEQKEQSKELKEVGEKLTTYLITAERRFTRLEISAGIDRD